MVEEIDDLVDAAVWVILKSGRAIDNETGLRHTIRKRIESSPAGVNPDDLHALIAWRAAKEAAIARDNKQKLARDQEIARKIRVETEESSTEKIITSFELIDISKREVMLHEFSEYIRHTNPLFCFEFHSA